jgi:muconolactone D-isomerase
MEFLVEFDLTTPEGASEDDIAARTEAEGVASAELARAGYLERLWTVSRAPGRWKGVGLYYADDEAELDALLGALPLYSWMHVTVTPLEAHAHDPGAAARSATLAGTRVPDRTR